MSEEQFRVSLIVIAAVFTAVFSWLMTPALMANPDVVRAFASGFVNPFASGYSTDVICCWFILVTWVIYEARNYGIKHGWVCVVLGFLPGVAVGFALYLIVRMSPKNKAAFKSSA